MHFQPLLFSLNTYGYEGKYTFFYVGIHVEIPLKGRDLTVFVFLIWYLTQYLAYE